jgi:hypothetical protein
MRIPCVLIAVTMLLACRPPGVQVPGQGGPAWFEVKSEHFTLWTDTSGEQGVDLVHDMERRWQVIAIAMNRASSTARTFAVALRNAREVEPYVPRGIVAWAWPRNSFVHQPMVLLNAREGRRGEVVAHELSHVISYGIIENQPRWLAEGLATYFETADLYSDLGYVKIGGAPIHARNLPRSLIPIADLLECTKGCSDAGYYATSWVLFCFLLNEHLDQLGRFLQRLNQLSQPSHADIAALWREEFPGLTPEVLDQRLRGWLRIGEIALPRIKVSVRDVRTTVRPLGDADVLALRSLLGVKIEDDAAARRDVDAALVLDRTNVLARLIKVGLTHEIAAGDARATAAAHPDDWRAWWLVQRAVPDTPEGDAALAQMCALAQTEPPCARREAAMQRAKITP